MGLCLNAEVELAPFFWQSISIQPANLIRALPAFSPARLGFHVPPNSRRPVWPCPPAL